MCNNACVYVQTASAIWCVRVRVRVRVSDRVCMSGYSVAQADIFFEFESEMLFFWPAFDI